VGTSKVLRPAVNRAPDTFLPPFSRRIQVSRSVYMLKVQIITKEEKRAEAKAKLRVVCKGLTPSEFTSIERLLKDDLGCKTLRRNPFVPQFDAKAVHEIIAFVKGNAIALYASKKAIDAAFDVLKAYVKFRLTQPPSDGQKRQITIYDGSGNVYEGKDKKRKKKG
jgi:hypothetical protein